MLKHFYFSNKFVKKKFLYTAQVPCKESQGTLWGLRGFPHSIVSLKTEKTFNGSNMNNFHCKIKKQAVLQNFIIDLRSSKNIPRCPTTYGYKFVELDNITVQIPNSNRKKNYMNCSLRTHG